MSLPECPPMPSAPANLTPSAVPTDWRAKCERLEAEADRVRQLLRAVGQSGIILRGEPVAPSVSPYVPMPLDHQVALYIARNSVK